MDRLKSEEEKTDIDRLLIVTFTNAAAAEMRERIRIKIMECLEEEPENGRAGKRAPAKTGVSDSQCPDYDD